MVDILLEIIGSLFGTVVDDWFRQQSWWVKTIVVDTVVFIVFIICYFTVFLPFFSNSGGS